MPSLSHFALRGPQFLYSPALLEVLSKQAALTVLAQSLQDPSSEIRVASLQGLGNILFHPEKVRARGTCSPRQEGWVGTLALSLGTLTLPPWVLASSSSEVDIFLRGHSCSPGTGLLLIRRDRLSRTTPEAHEEPDRQHLSPCRVTPLRAMCPLSFKFRALCAHHSEPYSLQTAWGKKDCNGTFGGPALPSFCTPLKFRLWGF